MQLKQKIKKVEEQFVKTMYPNYSRKELETMSDEQLTAIGGENPKLTAVLETFTDDELNALLDGNRHLISKEKLEALKNAVETQNQKN